MALMAAPLLSEFQTQTTFLSVSLEFRRFCLSQNCIYTLCSPPTQQTHEAAPLLVSASGLQSKQWML
eukprot:4709588-Pleurochrysis_carterae.AAC.1